MYIFTCLSSGVAVYPAVTLLQGHYIEDRLSMRETIESIPRYGPVYVGP